METQVNKFPRPLIWTAGIAIILFCAAGIAAIMGWIPASMSYPGDDTAPAQREQAQAGTVPPAAAPVNCANCGIIESTREVATRGEGTGLGAAGGAVVGGLLGSQVGGGHGQDIATVVGAVGGAVAGNEVEKRVKSTKGYEVTVRMDDGTSRVIYESTAPMWRNGDHVRIVDGAIRSN